MIMAPERDPKKPKFSWLRKFKTPRWNPKAILKIIAVSGHLWPPFQNQWHFAPKILTVHHAFEGLENSISIRLGKKCWLDGPTLGESPSALKNSPSPRPPSKLTHSPLYQSFPRRRSQTPRPAGDALGKTVQGGCGQLGMAAKGGHGDEWNGTRERAGGWTRPGAGWWFFLIRKSWLNPWLCF